jgi:acyl carrier protein
MTDTAELTAAILKIAATIAPEADFNALAPGENLREALDLDSFDFLNLLIGIHEALGVEIPESDYGEVSTLAGLVKYLAARLPETV